MTNNITSKIKESWRGIAFEETCWQHITQLKHALGINGIKSKISSWSIKGNDITNGAQIDLLIIRDDNVINLCEIKFSGDAYQIDKDEELKLRRRIATLKEHISPRQSIHLTMITTYGITNGKHSDIVQKQIIMDDLFAV